MTFGLKSMSAELTWPLITPAPEPLEVAEETPSPVGGETMFSGTPPGASSCWTPATPPVMSIRSDCDPEAASISMASGPME